MKFSTRHGMIPVLLGISVGIVLGIFLFQHFLLTRENQSEHNSVSSGVRELKVPLESASSEFSAVDCLEFFGDSNFRSSYPNIFDRIDDTSPDQLEALVSQCSTSPVPSIRAHDMQGLLLGKLAQTQPARALQVVLDLPRSNWKDLLFIVFGEWAVLDVKGALRASSGLSEPHKSAIQRMILSTFDTHSIQDFNGLISNLGLDSLVDRQERETIAMQNFDDPKLAWNLVIQDDIPDALQESLLIRITELYIQRGDYEVIGLLIDDLLGLDHRLVDRILEATLGSVELSAFEYGLSMSSSRQRRFFPRLFALWSQSDPKSALTATLLVPKSSDRRTIQSELLAAWAKKNPQELLDSIDQVPSQLQQKFVLYAIREIANSSPEEAATEIEGLQPLLGSIDDSTEYLLVRYWAENDPDEALKWIYENSQEGTEKRARMMQRVLTQFALVDFNKAIEVALDEKPHPFHGMTGLESEVIGSLARSGELDTAIALLKRVRQSARRSSFMHVGIGLVESERTAEAIELSHQLSEQEQLRYFRNIVSTWLSSNPIDLLERFPTLPSQSLRSEIARTILNRSEDTLRSLTSDQVTYLSSFLNDGKIQDSSD